MKFTYGAELELADIDQRKGLPEGCGWDTSDPTMVNSDGIAVDPKGKHYPYGGEVQTKPTDSIQSQVEVFEEVMEHFGNARVNHRTNLHIHIGFPKLDLKNNLPMLKRFQRIIHTPLQYLINKIEPIPEPSRREYLHGGAYAGAMKRFRRRKRSHHMFLPEARLKNQLKSKTVKEFFDNEAPRTKDNKPMFHAQARVCINLRQLLQTNTIEFRHFPGTTNPEEFRACLNWCSLFCTTVISKQSVLKLWKGWGDKLNFPKFVPYQHDLEMTYLQTCWDGKVDKKKIPNNIKKVLHNKPKILVICLGNINRSPSIEAILKFKGYNARSAGFISSPPKRATGKARRYMASKGYNMEKHKSQKVTDELCSWADIILVTTLGHQHRFKTTYPKWEILQKVKCLYHDVKDPHMMKEDSELFKTTMEGLEFETQLFLDILTDPNAKVQRKGLIF